jgi:hypothetical protein
MRVNLVVVGDPRWQLVHHGLGIWTRTDADVVAFDRAHESFSHSVALWTFDRRRSGFETDGASEAAGIASDVAAAVVGEPFDGRREAIEPAEPMLNGSHHQVTHVLACDAARGGEQAHGFAITAVQCEGNAHLFTVVAANLKAVGAPAPIVFIHCDPTVVPPLGTAAMAIEQEATSLHGPCL